VKVDKLFISFSGGETSAYMTQRLIEEGQFNEVVVLFANTGLEHENTLVFVDQFSRYFDVEVIWLEAEVQHGVRKSTQGKVVTFETAARKGEPFEEVIKKYGIPCNGFPHCTRELKMRPLHWYVQKHLGWNTYHTAIGIRADEFDRASSEAKEKRYIYPLIDWGVQKPEVNRFWRDQPFRLNIKGYEGNCVACWKKSYRKHFTLLEDNPEAYDFFKRMEVEHAHTGAGQGPRRFFRGHKTVQDLIDLKNNDDWKRAEDDKLIYGDLDANYGCSESCEIY
jgi:hypothetical protein